MVTSKLSVNSFRKRDCSTSTASAKSENKVKLLINEQQFRQKDYVYKLFWIITNLSGIERNRLTALVVKMKNNTDTNSMIISKTKKTNVPWLTNTGMEQKTCDRFRNRYLFEEITSHYFYKTQGERLLTLFPSKFMAHSLYPPTLRGLSSFEASIDSAGMMLK